MSLRKHIVNSSIKVRLTVLLVLVSVVISYFTMTLTHNALHVSLSNVEDDFLRDRLRTIQAIIEKKANYLQIIRNDIEWEGEHVSFPCYYLRILDRSGRELIATPGMNRQIPTGSFPPAGSPRVASRKDSVFSAANGRQYLLRSDSVTTSQPGASGLTVQIALDTTSGVTTIEANHRKVVAMVVLRTLILAVLVILIIRKVLRPLDEMVQVAESVSVNEISIRAESEGLPAEVKRLACSFNQMLDRLEDAFGRISYSASNIAHELRTPINNIMGEAEIALSRERSPEEYRKVLVSGVEECQRLSNLINTLLFLARADNPRDSIQRVPFNAREEIAEILDFYGPQIEEKGARVACSGDGEIYGDPILFRQAVSNLLRNALNYSPPGPAINIAVTAAEQHVDVTVSDTGYGIREEDIPVIFERYKRLHDAGAELRKGSGLGLSIVKAIMNMHHGSVTVVSKPGEGTAMTLRFPVS